MVVVVTAKPLNDFFSKIILKFGMVLNEGLVNGNRI
jgi:hypothetical protein